MHSRLHHRQRQRHRERYSNQNFYIGRFGKFLRHRETSHVKLLYYHKGSYKNWLIGEAKNVFELTCHPKCHLIHPYPIPSLLFPIIFFFPFLHGSTSVHQQSRIFNLSNLLSMHSFGYDYVTNKHSRLRKDSPLLVVNVFEFVRKINK